MNIPPRTENQPPAAHAPNSDVVLSSRVRMARNIGGFPFVNRASAAQCQELMGIAKPVLLDLGRVLKSQKPQDMIWVDLNQAPLRDRRLLFERHLISKNLCESDHRRAVAISSDESLSIMVNEEDHLRMQILAPGAQLANVFERLNAVDDAIEGRIDYAFSPRWGYLTACPTNVGTGIRFSVMMHLPALKMTNEIDRVRRAAKDLHLAVRGYYGEGSESAGDFYQISNQVTLGRSEQEILKEFQEVILPSIVEYEHQARRMMMERSLPVLDDRVHRAIGALRSARLLGVEEAMKLLSRVRLGIHMGRLTGINAAVVNELFLQVQPTHLNVHAKSDLSPDELRVARAVLVRRRLS
jgi:protein arginine kinase